MAVIAVPKVLQYPLAVIAGIAVAQIAPLPIGAFIDGVYGAVVTGVPWRLNVPNVTVITASEILAGYIAGWVASAYGKLIGALTVLLPYLGFLLIAVIARHLNRSLVTDAGVWAPISVIPAIIGGHLGVQYKALPVSLLRWHWLWFLPFLGYVIVAVERTAIISSYVQARFAFYNLTFGTIFLLLLSPSADLCVILNTCSLILPIAWLGWLFHILTVPRGTITIRYRMVYSVLIILGIFAVPFIIEVLIWGSYPIVFDDQGFEHIRMIPFFPWPHAKCCTEIGG
jgi:hypothetical protein